MEIPLIYFLIQPSVTEYIYIYINEEEETYEIRVVLHSEILWSTFHEQFNEVENKVTAFLAISLLWYLILFYFYNILVEAVSKTNMKDR